MRGNMNLRKEPSMKYNMIGPTGSLTDEDNDKTGKKEESLAEDTLELWHIEDHEYRSPSLGDSDEANDSDSCCQRTAALSE